MTKSKIDIHTGKLFGWHFQLVAILLLVVALVIIADRTAISLVLMLVSLIILTGQSGIEFNARESTYREYLSFLFIKKGTALRYAGLEKIFINTSKVSQKMHGPFINHSHTFSSIEFNGYLKFSDGKKIHLLSSPKKADMMRRLNVLSDFLNVRIEDQSSI